MCRSYFRKSRLRCSPPAPRLTLVSVVVLVLVVGASSCVRAGFRQGASNGDLGPADGRGDVAWGIDIEADTDAPSVTPDLTAKPDGSTPDGSTPDTSTPDASSPDAWTTPGWITVVKGTFQMGSPTWEACRYNDEDRHEVTLSRGFEIQRTEVTQGEFAAVMGYNPSYLPNCGTTCPVESVSWSEATAYCNALSAKKQLARCYQCSGSGETVSCTTAAAYSGSKIYTCPGYRLPTDAEWEYAYRAGSTTPYYNGANSAGVCHSCSSVDGNAHAIGWYCANASSTTHPVGSKSANAWGLEDMAGNVAELCHDWYQANLGASAVTDPVGAAAGTNHVVRGGGWNKDASSLRAASRLPWTITSKSGYVGFRCVRSM